MAHLFVSTKAVRQRYPSYVFFTYPRTSLTPAAFVADFITSLNPVSYTVVRERHTAQATGEHDSPYHLHALVRLKARAWTPGALKTVVKAQYPDHWQRIHFGRIAKHSSPLKAYEYLLKDPVGDVIQHGPTPSRPVHPLIVAYAKELRITPAALLAQAAASVAAGLRYDEACARARHRWNLYRCLVKLNFSADTHRLPCNTWGVPEASGSSQA